jgi:hypothetical protein
MFTIPFNTRTKIHTQEQKAIPRFKKLYPEQKVIKGTNLPRIKKDIPRYKKA